MEDERKNNLEETTVEAEQVVEKPQHPMKWFKFIIYVQLFLNVVFLGFQGVSFITGMQYGANADLIYAYYGNALKAFDILCGFMYLALSIFAFYTRTQLAKFKKNGPKCYLIFWGTQEVVAIIYAICIIVITQQFVLLPTLFAGLLGTVISICLYYVYFKKRKDLFVN